MRPNHTAPGALGVAPDLTDGARDRFQPCTAFVCHCSCAHAVVRA